MHVSRWLKYFFKWMNWSMLLYKKIVIGSMKGGFEVIGQNECDSSYFLYCARHPKYWNSSHEISKEYLNSEKWIIKILWYSFRSNSKVINWHVLSFCGHASVSIHFLHTYRLYSTTNTFCFYLDLGNDTCSKFKDFFQKIEKLVDEETSTQNVSLLANIKYNAVSIVVDDVQ